MSTLRNLMAAQALILTLSSTSGFAAQTDLISFEPDPAGYLPDGTLATDNLTISSQYRAQYGVSFGFDYNQDLQIDTGSSLQLENTANSGGDWGYVSTNGNTRYNSAAAGFEQQLGDWFLTSDRSQPGSNRLLVTYDNPVSAASGEIWDIDGRNNGTGEQWLVSAYDADGEVLAELKSPFGLKTNAVGNLDAKPWLWSFDVGNGGQIASIVMSNIGTAGNGPVAFNNFATRSATNELLSEDTVTTVSAPEPAFWLMFASFGAIGAVSIRRKMAGKKA